MHVKCFYPEGKKDVYLLSYFRRNSITNARGCAHSLNRITINKNTSQLYITLMHYLLTVSSLLSLITHSPCQKNTNMGILKG